VPAVKSTTRVANLTTFKSRDPTRLRPAHCKCLSEHYCRRNIVASRQHACRRFPLTHPPPCPARRCTRYCRAVQRSARSWIPTRPASRPAIVSAANTATVENRKHSARRRRAVSCIAPVSSAPDLAAANSVTCARRHYIPALSLPALHTRAATKARSSSPASVTLDGAALDQARN
jgi:hypothetical protein